MSSYCRYGTTSINEDDSSQVENSAILNHAQARVIKVNESNIEPTAPCFINKKYSDSMIPPVVQLKSEAKKEVPSPGSSISTTGVPLNNLASTHRFQKKEYMHPSIYSKTRTTQNRAKFQRDRTTTNAQKGGFGARKLPPGVSQVTLSEIPVDVRPEDLILSPSPAPSPQPSQFDLPLDLKEVIDIPSCAAQLSSARVCDPAAP